MAKSKYHEEHPEEYTKYNRERELRNIAGKTLIRFVSGRKTRKSRMLSIEKNIETRKMLQNV